MLRILTDSKSRMCDGLSRRSFLQIGMLGTAGLGLPHLLASAARAGVRATGPSKSYVKDKSVILLFLAGGPSQLETFDPKPDGIGTSTSLAGHIPTSIPGVRFASYFPKLAKLAHRMTIVRSFHTHHAEHDGAHKQIMTADISIADGKPIKQPGMGAVYARAAGPTHPQTGMPRQAVVPPTTRHIQGAVGFTEAYESVVAGCQPAWLGPACTPFEIKASMAEGQTPEKKRKRGEEEPSNPMLENLQPNLPDLRLRSRHSLMKQLDQLDRSIDTSGVMQSMDEYTQQAIELLRGGAMRKALDLSLEDPRILKAYDTEHFRNYRCGDDSKFIRSGPSIGISLGRQLLLARRLCEAGCGFVTVVHSNWDFHARKGIPNMPEGMGVLAPPMDHAVDAFLRDTEARGLDDKILLCITGEFGRTPTLDDKAGRHHWPRICPLVFAGGGLKHGQVVGQSDKRGGEPATDPYSIDDLHATMMHAMFDIGELRLDSALPRIVQERASNGRPIREMF